MYQPLPFQPGEGGGKDTSSFYHDSGPFTSSGLGEEGDAPVITSPGRTDLNEEKTLSLIVDGRCKRALFGVARSRGSAAAIFDGGKERRGRLC